MKTKLFTLSLALICNIGTIFASVAIDGFTFDLNEKELTAVLTGCSLTDSVVIPDSVTYQTKKYCIKSVGDYAFDKRTGMTSVTIPYNITSIGQSAFNGCTGLTSITIPDNVLTIGSGAFSGCTSLTSATLSNNITSLEDYLFNGCGYLTSVVIPNGVTSIGYYSFYNCTHLTSIIIPNSVTIIGGGAFRNCRNLTSLTIGINVTNISRLAFASCTSLTSISIPNSVTNIEDYAFDGCNSLASVTCLAVFPPSMGTGVFTYAKCSKIPLYVPADAIYDYKYANQWKDFGSILPISAKTTETTGIQTTSTENTVDISWPVISGVAKYELIIKDAEGNEICTLVFNAKGQLVSFAFHAPSRNNAPQQLQETGFVYTITGLSSGKKYTYVFTATNNSGNILRTESGTFYTNSPTGVDDIQNTRSQSSKVFRNGQILILRGDHTYTLTSQEVK